MMNLSKYVLISAALLSGAACLTACSSDDTVSDVVNPNLSPDGKAVKTEFALNIPAGRGMRMTGENTQQSGSGENFLGMKDIKLIPLKNATYQTSDVVTELIKLEDIANNGLSNNTKKYSDVMIPVGTKGFLFYGHAEEGTDAGTYFSKGKLSSNVALGTAPSAYEFALTATTNSNTVYTNAQATAILTALNAIVAVEGWADENENTEMGKLFKTFTNLKAGSAKSVLAAVQSLYDNVKGYTEETALGTKIKNAITAENSQFSESQGTLSWKRVESADVVFPENVNLPDGAVALKFNTEEGDNKNKFTWDNKKTSIGSTDNSINIANITYPASLYYMAETGVKTNESPTAQFPTSLTDWIGQDAFKDWGTEVKTTTRKIALAGSVNYGVALLETKFKCNAATLTAGTVNGVQQNVTVTSDGFPVTGLLVGGQPEKVGYNFEPKGENFTKTVYDNAIVKDLAAKTGDASAANYTMLLSNRKYDSSSPSSPTSDQAAIYFAVELTNKSGIAFRGADGIVPVDGTFYLIGKLDPKDRSVKNVTNPSVFMPDYKTTATVNITSLAKAYNCIPDLRSTNLELGLAVDLTWKTGIDFDNVEIGAE